MTSHELAKELLDCPDVPVCKTSWEDGPELITSIYTGGDYPMEIDIDGTGRKTKDFIVVD